MSAYLFGDSTAYPSLTVEIGIPSGTQGVWGGSVWGTGLWADPSTVWADITAYVRTVSTSWERSRELSAQPANVANLVLSNNDGRFTPGNLSGPYVVAGTSQIRPRVPLRIQATWNSVTYPVFYGMVTNWQDNLPGYGKDLVTSATAVDVGSQLAAVRVDGATTGTAGSLPGTRIADILNTVFWPFGSDLDTGTSTLQVDTTNDTAATLLQHVADSDGGIWFVDRDGTFTYHDRDHRSTATRSTATQITFSAAGTKFDEPQLSQDDTAIFNVITVTGEGLAEQTATDADSIGLYGSRYLAISGWMTTTGEAADLASFWVSVLADAEYRVDRVRMTPAVSASTYWPLTLDAQIADRHSVTVAIPGGGSVTKLVHVAGISHSITPDDGWRVTFGYSSATPF